MAKSTKSTKLTANTTTESSNKKLVSKSNEAKSKEFAYKSIGQNVILVKGEDKYSRKFSNKEDREIIKALVESYNKKPTIKAEKDIISRMNLDKEARKEEIETIKKGEKKVAKKPEQEKMLSKEEQIEAAKKLLQDNNYNVTAKTAPKTYSGRREY